MHNYKTLSNETSKWKKTNEMSETCLDAKMWLVFKLVVSSRLTPEVFSSLEITVWKSIWRCMKAGPVIKRSLCISNALRVLGRQSDILKKYANQYCNTIFFTPEKITLKHEKKIKKRRKT